MRRVLVVASLLGAMLLVDWLKQSEVFGAASLAGMGFVMLAAYAVAELGVALSLPQVTGYIVAGVALGPSVGGVISGELVGDMRMFNTLALGLIATSAGLELDFRQMARLAKTLLLTTLVKVLVGVSAVALALVALESTLGLLGLASRAEITTLALVMGVLSIGTSPSITLAVLSETRAKGRLSDLVLGAAVFKDLVVVVGLAVATAIGRVWLSPGAALDAGVLMDVALELGGSMLAGALVGLIFIIYVRFIGAEMLLFIAAMILVVAELCRAFHLELLLVFIAAGFVVRNFSRHEHELMQPLRLVALPVFVLFFANAGASVDLKTTFQILPLALVLCLARAASYLLASHLGGKWAGEPPGIRRQAWLAYLPQAGVTLGLVGVAGLQLPELVGPITNTGMAVVALNLLVGPITLRRALGRLGEIPSVDPAARSAGTREAAPSRPPHSDTESSPPRVAPLPLPLGRLSDALGASLRNELESFARDREPHLPRLPALARSAPELEAFREVVMARRERYRELYARLMAPLATLPSSLRVDWPEARPSSLIMRALPRVGKVPLRRLARIALGPPLAQAVSRLFEAGLSGGDSATEAPRAGEAGPSMPEIDAGLEHLAQLAYDVVARRSSPRRLRYSDVDPRVRRSLHSLRESSDADLARLARGAWGSALLERERDAVRQKLDAIISRNLVEPARAAAARVHPVIAELGAWLGQQQLEGDGEDHLLELARLRGDFDALARLTASRVAGEFRFTATVRTTLAELLECVAGVPERIERLVLPPATGLTHGKVQPVPLRAHVEALIRHLMPPIDLAARAVATAHHELPRRIEDVLQREWSLIEAQIEAGPAALVKPLATLRLSEAQRALDEVATSTVRALETAMSSLNTAIDAAYAGLNEDLAAGPARDGRREARLQRWLAAARKLLDLLTRRVDAAVGGPPPLATAEGVREWLHRRSQQSLPEAFERWFDSAPVSDDRIFAARERLLNYVLDAEGSRAEAGRASILVVGGKGAGKTSLLNLCEVELPHALHLRLHASEFARDVTLLEATASLLDCPATLGALTHQLAERAPAIFVDDLQAWISAKADRHTELERVLRLVTQTSHRAFWIISIETSMLRLFRELLPVDEAFTHVLRLTPLSRTEIGQLVAARLELAGLDVNFPAPRLTALFDALRSRPAGARFYHRLWRASRGHPARAVALCREALSVDRATLTLSPAALQARPPFVCELTPRQLAALVTLHRYGPQPVERIALELGVVPADLWRSLTFLMAAGLVAVADGRFLGIAPGAEEAVLEALGRARLAVE